MTQLDYALKDNANRGNDMRENERDRSPAASKVTARAQKKIGRNPLE